MPVPYQYSALRALENDPNEDVIDPENIFFDHFWPFLTIFRMPVPYQYSALRTFDNDPDEDVIDPENNLNMMVDDSTSEDEEIVDSTPATLGSKTIGAIDLDNPPDANAVSQGPL